MGTAELKVSMFEIIAKTSDEHTLTRLYQKMKEVFEDTYASEYALSAEQEKELFLSYDESFIEENLASHEEALKRHSKWLK